MATTAAVPSSRAPIAKPPGAWRVAPNLADYAVITIEGFADPSGSIAFNRRLGMERAEAVRGYLTSSGSLADANLRAVSYGESRDRQVIPGAQGPGPEGMENRRVALVIDYASPEAEMETVESDVSLN